MGLAPTVGSAAGPAGGVPKPDEDWREVPLGHPPPRKNDVDPNIFCPPPLPLCREGECRDDFTCKVQRPSASFRLLFFSSSASVRPGLQYIRWTLPRQTRCPFPIYPSASCSLPLPLVSSSSQLQQHHHSDHTTSHHSIIPTSTNKSYKHHRHQTPPVPPNTANLVNKAHDLNL